MFRHFAPPLGMTIVMIPALLFLLFLGTWQVQRLYWKQDLITRFESNIAAEIVDWQSIQSQAFDAQKNATPDQDAVQFRRIRLKGTFLHQHEMYMTGRSRNGEPGLIVVTPFKSQDGTIIAVQRGWIDSEDRDQHRRMDGLFAGNITLTALYRRSVPVRGIRAWVLPENDTIKNTWYTFDLPQMAAFTGLNIASEYYFMDEREGEPKPLGRQWKLQINNSHLEYAITWYGLALGLLMVFIGFGVNRAKEIQRVKD